MLQRLQRAPIRQKLMLIAMVTTGGALLLAGIALIYFNVSRFQEEMKRDLVSLADIVAQNSTAALSFNDTNAARDTLSALRSRPSIIGAALYDSHQKLFYPWSPVSGAVFPARPEEDGPPRFQNGSLVVFRPVTLKGERIGTVYLRSNLDELTARVWTQAITVLAVFLASGIVALMLSSGLQRLISRPILDLTGTARAVSQSRDYSLRATRRTDDELGELVDAFNGMLDQIQRRDSELQRAKDVLEERVQERTRSSSSATRSSTRATRSSTTSPTSPPTTSRSRCGGSTTSPASCWRTTAASSTARGAPSWRP